MSDITSGSYPSPFAGLGGSLRRNRRRMLITFLGSTTLFGAIAFFMPPSYKAEAMLMVRLGPEYLINGDPATTSMFQEHQEIVASEAGMLQAPDLARKVINQIGLAHVYPSLAADIDAEDPLTEHDAMERAVIKLESRLSVLPVKDTTLLSVTYKNNSPQIAADVLRAIVNGYLKDRRAHFEYGNGRAFSELITETRAVLERHSQELDDYKRTNNITDIDRQTGALFDEIALLTHDRDEAALDKQRLSIEAGSLMREVEGNSSVVLTTTTGPGQGLQAIRTELAKLQLDRNSAALAFKAETPQMQDVQRHVDMTQTLLRHGAGDQEIAITTGRSREYDNLATALAQAQASAAASDGRLQMANDAIAKISMQIAQLDRIRVGYLQLMRDVKTAEDAYYQAAKRISEASAHDQMMEAARPNVEVIQEARTPFEETWTRIIVAAAGALLGVLGASTFLYFDSVGRGWKTQ